MDRRRAPADELEVVYWSRFVSSACRGSPWAIAHLDARYSAVLFDLSSDASNERLLVMSARPVRRHVGAVFEFSKSCWRSTNLRGRGRCHRRRTVAMDLAACGKWPATMMLVYFVSHILSSGFFVPPGKTGEISRTGFGREML